MSADGLKKWAVVGVLGAGTVVAGYLIFSNFIVNPVNQWKDLTKQQLTELATKMANFAEQNPEGFTQAQQESIDIETQMLQQTLQEMSDASKGVIDIGLILSEAVAAAMILTPALAVTYKYLPDAIKKWRTSHPTNAFNTATAAADILSFSLAEDLQIRGFPNHAAGLINSTNSLYEAYQLPFMNSTISMMTQALPGLTGSQLYVAQQIIESMNLSKMAIPAFLALPPLPI